MIVQQRLAKLRALMKERNIQAYLIPSADYHSSEYVGDYFKLRAFMSGFTGSAGTLLVTENWAGLWTDGRYFIQAGHQLEGSGIELMRMGSAGVPTLEEWLAKNLPEGNCLGFDGRVVGVTQARDLRAAFGDKEIRYYGDEDLVGMVWENRPPISKKPAWLLDERYSGRSAGDKLAWLRGKLEEKGAAYHVITALDEVAWLYNMRGGDVDCTPVALAYTIVGKDEAKLYLHQEILDSQLLRQFEKLQVEIFPYEDILEGITALAGKGKVLVDPRHINIAFLDRIPEEQRLEGENPCMLAKAVKNPVEMENMRQAHIKDGAAMAKFLCWVDKNVGKTKMTELSASAYLEECRKGQEGFLEDSFATIAAYGAHAAMCHYSPTEESDCAVEPKGLFLVDSGGQYYEGTTDITRTIAVGPLTEEEKLHYTLVLKGHIALAQAKFLYGSRGVNLDYAARKPLWERGLDYNHGTGHGVGCLLSVHEGPNNIRWKLQPNMVSAVMEEGMITSNEPGYYEENSHGIRTENLVLCVKDVCNQYGQFMKFETLTMAPIDLRPVDFSLITPEEIQWLDDYHKKVYTLVSPLVDPEVREWLEKACAPVAAREKIQGSF